MANSNSKILEEYLLALGFRIDPQGQRDFDNTLGKFDKTIKGLGVGLLTVTGALVGLVSEAANSMETLYYTSRRAGTSVNTLQAMGYGAAQIGVNAEQITGIMDSFGMSLRRNPGLVGLLKGLGVDYKGDSGKGFVDLVTRLSKMPFPIAAAFAENFGIDEKTLFMLEDNLPKFKEAMELRRKMSQEAGIDDQKAAEAAVAYNRELDTMKERLVVLRNVIAVEFMPVFKWLTEHMSNAIVAWGKDIQKDMADARSGSGGKLRTAGKVAANMNPLSAMAYWAQAMSDNGEALDKGGPGTRRSAVAPAGAVGSPRNGKGLLSPQIAALLDQNNEGLPPGLLTRLALQESSGNPNALGPLLKNGDRAKGLMQFTSATADEKRINPFDPTQAIPAAREYILQLLREFGNIPLALAAYNAGPGNIEKYKLGQYTLKPETVDYVDKLAGVHLSPNTTIHVHGNDDPVATGRVVAQEQTRVVNDVVRNMKGVLQ